MNKLGSGRKKDQDSFIQKALKVCKVFKVKPLKTPKPDVPSKKTAYNLFFKVAGCSRFQGKHNHIEGMEKRLRPARRRWKSTETFTKKRNDDMKRHWRDIKKIIWMKWRLLTFTKGVTRRPHSPKKHQSHSNQINLKSTKVTWIYWWSKRGRIEA